MIDKKRYLQFNVSARTAKLIGMENFANAEGAIIELVKNTYDADSKVCFIVFDLRSSKENSSIYIIDNGCGMTEEVIAEHWMTIGTDDKLKNLKSLKGRVKSGAKGIGRFALNRLGLISEMFTFSEETNTGLFWKIDWADFDKIGYNLSDINASLSTVSNYDLQCAVNSYGLLQFENIKTVLDSNFKGTVLKISNLNDFWDEADLNTLNANLENLIPSHLTSDFKIFLYSLAAPEAYGMVKSANYDDFDYRVDAEYPGTGNTIKVTIHRNELNVSLLETKYNQVFDYPAMRAYPFRLKDFRKGTFTIDAPISSNIDLARLEKIGEFRFVFYYVKNTTNDDPETFADKKYPYNSVDSASRKNWLKKFRGVKIYRDEFRVRPYGEDGNDWLGLGERQGRSPGGAGQKMGGYRIRPNQISGAVYISRIQNIAFEDKSSREGIQENEEFILFKNLLLTIIESFETDRNTIMFHLAQLYKKTHPTEKKAKEISDKLNSENRYSSYESQSDEQILARGFSSLENELNDKEAEIRLLRGLASSGIAVASFTHELRSLSKRLIPRTELLVTTLKNFISEEQLLALDKYDNPFFQIELIRHEDEKLHQWLDYSLNTIKRDKRERKVIYVDEYFSRFEQLWKESLRSKSIDLEITGDEKVGIRGFEMDLDSIFNNFISNSVTSLLRTERQNKRISVMWKVDHDFLIIDFEDNGTGLVSEYRGEPDIIFNAFETSTKDKNGQKIGTGMGLYIAKGIVDEYKDASINITKIDSGFGIRVIFKFR